MRVWTGDWVARNFGVRLHTAADSHRPLEELVGLALRRNPRRAHLLVSTVLDKHVPADPRLVRDTGLELGERVAAMLTPAELSADLVLGFAETATGLGHFVAEALGAPYLHSTRRHVATATPYAGFEEEHSHATSHRLLPEDPALLDGRGPLVLVDDELSTGRTARNTIAALHAAAPRSRYVVATLVDLRGEADHAAMIQFAADLGVTVDVVALASGTVRWPEDFPERAAAAVEQANPASTRSPGAVGELVRHRALWPREVREGGRHGFGPLDVEAARRAAAAVADELVPRLAGEDVLVLGTEELMYAPTLIGVHLADRVSSVRVSSTT
ncbi:MAG: phosphoribosyltransferase domain-containing protein, partial [Jatrophihabitans sp.]